ncbi:MAG: hypothetical protein SF002_00080 [Alphaproteobacteria bacterium]|nr:hypothetical protein [Alphaproteobacteria bacterium]
MPAIFIFCPLMPQRSDALASAERWVLWGLRMTVEAQRCGRPQCRYVFDQLEGQGLGDCAGPLAALVRLCAMGARRPLAIASPIAAVLTADEQRLLSALQRLQADPAASLTLVLSDLLAPAAVRLAAGPLGDIANHLTAAAVTLPLRRLPPELEAGPDCRAIARGLQ